MKPERQTINDQVLQIRQVSKRFILMSFISTMCFFALYLTYLPATLYGSNEPVAAVAEKQYDFGQVSGGSEVIHDFLIRNQGAAPLIISDVKTG